MAVIQGADFTSKVIPPGYPQLKRKNGVWTKVEKWYISSDKLMDNLPSASAVEGDLGLSSPEISINKNLDGFPGICEITVTWNGTDTSEAGQFFNGVNHDTSVSYEAEATRREKPIESHPDWPNLTADQQTKLKKHFASFSIWNVIFRRVETYNKEDKLAMTESVIAGLENATKNPPLSGTVSSGKWNYTGRQIHWKKKGHPEMTDTWEYDKYGWDNVIDYDTELSEIISKLLAKS